MTIEKKSLRENHKNGYHKELFDQTGHALDTTVHI